MQPTQMSVVVPTILDFGRIVLNFMAYLLSVRLPKQRLLNPYLIVINNYHHYLNFRRIGFFNRRLYDRLFDLYRVGQDETIDPSRFDINELEQVLYSSY